LIEIDDGSRNGSFDAINLIRWVLNLEP
jgi:hypothetical protein